MLLKHVVFICYSLLAAGLKLCWEGIKSKYSWWPCNQKPESANWGWGVNRVYVGRDILKNIFFIALEVLKFDLYNIFYLMAI